MIISKKSVLDKFSLKGKKAVITGGAGGMGSACAYAFAEAGADIAVFDVKPEDDPGIREVLRQIESYGRQAFYICVDLTEESEVITAFNKTLEKFGEINIVFSNAGVAQQIACEDMELSEWHRVISNDLDSMFLVARTAGRIMIKAGQGGVIINTGSMSGDIVNFPQPQAAYNAAKAGVIHLTKSLACEWAVHNIRVNCISPGYIHSPMMPVEVIPEDLMKIFYDRTPMKRVGVPDEIAPAVLYLASDASSFTTGAEIVIDGGYCCW
ncbi:MAG: SDR family oxidoreductase [Prevotella sp.]|jgi:NAD(P)-dependent dehydrogenase (short-subunit alcohol dehydrogenase family)|nr:SDR family oxidoreductase [Prevotella sp.]